MAADERPTKVLHFSDSDLSGGAAMAAFRLHAAMDAKGLSSRMIVRGKLSRRADVHLVPPSLNPWRWRLRQVRDAIPPLRKSLPPATGVFHYDVDPDIRTADFYRLSPGDVDVIYLHHVRHLLTTAAIQSLHAHYRCPLVWVLHSQAPVTGGCNYTLGCHRFAQRCGRCPQLGSSRDDDLSRKIWHRKDRRLRDLPLSFVAPSEAASRSVPESSLFSSKHVEVIPNPVDESVFQPCDRAAARMRLRLPAAAKIVAVAALGWDNYYKGGDYLVEALRRLSIGRPVFLAAVGEGGDALIAEAGVEGKALGQLEEESEMALVYQAADVFVSPSRAETGPQTIPEALLCGTPVVAFAIGAALDLIVHGETGYLAAEGDVADLARGMSEVLGWEDGRHTSACREAAMRHSFERVVDRHRRLHDLLLQRPVGAEAVA
jgi:glycosyltransferase involved in cell wall biosynthesis